MWVLVLISMLCVPQITDPAHQRFEVPIDVPVVKKRAPSPLYTVQLSKQPFGIVVKRTQNGAVL